MWKNAPLHVLCRAIFVCYLFAVSDAVVVKIQQGNLEGTVRYSRNGAKFHAFLGIPFAKPPVGELRFEAPQTPDPWVGVRDATKPPPACVQKIPAFILKSLNISEANQGLEDCLYLNVYTPSTAPDKLLPVLVFVHGGAFSGGSASMVEPDYFMDHPVVMVFIQYRLNVFGFLSTGDEILPGNYGLKDQLAALKWVRRNIADFRGDPERVTVFGISAGGASVHLLMHSPLSKGLFQRAISQSGTALAFWAQYSPWMADQKTRAFGILAGCPVESSATLKKCLKTIPAKEVPHIFEKLHVWDLIPLVLFSAVVEPKSVNDAFLTENPWNQNVQNNVPWMVGVTSAEGALFASRIVFNDKMLDELNENLERFLSIFIQHMYWSTAANNEAVTEALKQFYFGGEKISREMLKNFVDILSDGLFVFPCVEAAIRHTDKLYVYVYDHKTKNSTSKLFGGVSYDLGAGHGEDSGSLFPGQFSTKMTSASDLAVSERLVKYWVNFASTGNPSDDGTWLPSEKSEQLDYLHISTEKDVMKRGLRDDRYQLWKNLVDQRLQITSNENIITKNEF